MNVTVIIVTLNRPDYVRKCLECLRGQVRVPEEVIVVDASADERTRRVVAEFGGVVYMRNEKGYGRMTASRNMGLMRASGEIIAFLDDDAFAHEGWLENLLATYTDPAIGAVGGRARNNVPGEGVYRVAELGRLKPSGEIAGYFGADPGRIIAVDHIMGCNMSFRRQVLAELGGFREDYPGISGVCEDTDMSMRVRLAGHRMLFNPEAVVDHVGAPQAEGRRFDWRYAMFGQRNHLVLLIRNFGLRSAYPWRYPLHSAWRDARGFARRILAGPGQWGMAFSIVFGTTVGTLLGWPGGILRLLKEGRDPVRHDGPGREISTALGQMARRPESGRALAPIPEVRT